MVKSQVNNSQTHRQNLVEEPKQFKLGEYTGLESVQVGREEDEDQQTT
eukprot:COSAG02_NODE_43249_length_376_cov_1.314079_1_plen_47_part_01